MNTKQLLRELPNAVFYRITDERYLAGVLDSHYLSPERYYHNIHHIFHLIREAKSWHRDWSVDFYVAILFHDVIYDVTAPSLQNETKSALLAQQTIPWCFANIDLGTVTKLIMATTHKEEFASDDLCKNIADLDLVGLASSPEFFERNNKLVMQEFITAYSPEQVRIGRMEFFKTMLAKPQIYHYETNLEEYARFNMRRAYDELTQTV